MQLFLVQQRWQIGHVTNVIFVKTNSIQYIGCFSVGLSANIKFESQSCAERQNFTHALSLINAYGWTFCLNTSNIGVFGHLAEHCPMSER